MSTLPVFLSPPLVIHRFSSVLLILQFSNAKLGQMVVDGILCKCELEHLKALLCLEKPVLYSILNLIVDR